MLTRYDQTPSTVVSCGLSSVGLAYIALHECMSELPRPGPQHSSIGLAMRTRAQVVRNLIVVAALPLRNKWGHIGSCRTTLRNSYIIVGEQPQEMIPYAAA